MGVPSWLTWWLGLVSILWKTAVLTFTSVWMRIRFWLDPAARARDLERVTAEYNFLDEGARKYLGWRNERTVANFFYTTHMITVYFATLLQDLNKRARLHGPAPDPLLLEAGTGRETPLVGEDSNHRPLVINFGSCT